MPLHDRPVIICIDIDIVCLITLLDPDYDLIPVALPLFVPGSSFITGDGSIIGCIHCSDKHISANCCRVSPQMGFLFQRPEISEGCPSGDGSGPCKLWSPVCTTSDNPGMTGDADT